MHIHVMGASGSGTTSLGRALAERLDIAHLETDDFFWLSTDPPFTTPRDADRRIGLLLDEVARHEGWILSGSALKWGRPLEPLYDLIVFLRIDPELRMARIRARGDSPIRKQNQARRRHGRKKRGIPGMGGQL